jgi:hypothetical protein
LASQDFAELFDRLELTVDYSKTVSDYGVDGPQHNGWCYTVLPSDNNAYRVMPARESSAASWSLSEEIRTGKHDDAMIHLEKLNSFKNSSAAPPIHFNDTYWRVMNFYST